MKKHNMFTSSFLLALFALAGTAIVAYTFVKTKPLIKLQERKKFLRTLNIVLPATNYDNNILHDYIDLKNKALLGLDEKVRFYRARKNDKPIAVLFKAVAPDGYNGNIELLIGIYYNGSLAGVRVIKHKETPGLGDKIDARKSRWIITQFQNKSLRQPLPAQWKLKKDGGVFDQFTGASVTPRAVIKALHKALEFYKLNRKRLFASPENIPILP